MRPETRKPQFAGFFELAEELEEDAHGSSDAPTELERLCGGEVMADDHAVGPSQILVDDEWEGREPLGDADPGTPARRGRAA